MGISIPIWRAACHTVVPFGTATGRPSILRWTIGTFCGNSIDTPSGPHRRPDVAGPCRDVVLVLWSEIPEGGAEARGHALPQQAETGAGHIPGDSIQEVEVLHPAFASEDPVVDLAQPDRPLAAGRALPARLVAIELHRPPDHRRHAGGVVHDDDRARAEHGPDLGERLEIRRGLQVLGGN